MRSPRVVVRGGGDLATGTIHRLVQAGFQVIVTEIEKPTVIRRKVAAASAVFEKEIEIEGLTYKLVESLEHAQQMIRHKQVPVLIDPDMRIIEIYQPDLLVDATISKKNRGLHAKLAPVVIALGPGFQAPNDCHAVVETMRGHNLGRVYYSGFALSNTGIPGEIGGYSTERLLRAPANGIVKNITEIGQTVQEGQTIATVGDCPVIAQISGVVRGLIHEGIVVRKGMKIGDIDPRGNKSACSTISDKARAISGSVLEAFFKLRGGVLI